MTVKRIGYDEIDLDLIERGRSQARQEKVNVGIEDLALSIKVQGLMEPVHLVKMGGTGKIRSDRRTETFSSIFHASGRKSRRVFQDSMLLL